MVRLGVNMTLLKTLRELIGHEVKKNFENLFEGREISVRKKADQTLVTEVDLFISRLVKQNLPARYTLYCEEDHTTLEFPGVILDPIDGTRELSMGIPECGVSLAILETPEQGEAFVLNPFTGHDASTGRTKAFSSFNLKAPPYLGLVSRWEWKNGLYNKGIPQDIILAPRGSIAFKLAILSQNGCDFVISRRDKNIWDIAAGTLLAWEQGLKFYNLDGEISRLDQEIYRGPLLWAHPERFEQLRRLL